MWGRDQPSRLFGRGSPTEGLGQTIPRNDELANLRPQLLDFGLPRGLLPLVIPRAAGQHLLPSRRLPVGNQVWMDTVAGRQLRHRCFLAQGLQRDFRLQFSRITPSLPWQARLLLLGLDPTLASCPNFGVHLSLLRKEGLYSSHVVTWRQPREAGLTPKKRGRKMTAVDPQRKKLEQENRRLTSRLQKAEALLAFQKKVSELLQIPLKPFVSDEDD